MKCDQPSYVLINITDDNNHFPQFIPNKYTASVYENATIGTFVTIVTAVDEDVTSYPLTFSITNGDDYGLFNIVTNSTNTSNAVLEVSGYLDHEKVPLYELAITVTDTGGLFANAVVMVTILDVNDNGPYFEPPYYTGEVREEKLEQKVATLIVKDPDGPKNGGPFTYTIINGTHGADFRLQVTSEDTVNLYAYGVFLRSKRTEYTVLITATDNGVPQQIGRTSVYVRILDSGLNSFEPFGSQMRILVHAYEGNFTGGVIGKVYYQDNDYPGGANTYSLVTQIKSDLLVVQYFKIESTTGDITATKGLPLGTYNLKVLIEEKTLRSQEKSRKMVTSSVEVIVLPVTQNALQQSITVQFKDVKGVRHFVSRYYDVVQNAIFNIMTRMTKPFGYNGPFRIVSLTSPYQVLIFSLQKPQHSTNSIYAQIAVIDAIDQLEILFRFHKEELTEKLKGIQSKTLISYYRSCALIFTQLFLLQTRLLQE